MPCECRRVATGEGRPKLEIHTAQCSGMCERGNTRRETASNVISCVSQCYSVNGEVTGVEVKDSRNMRSTVTACTKVHLLPIVRWLFGLYQCTFVSY